MGTDAARMRFVEARGDGRRVGRLVEAAGRAAPRRDRRRVLRAVVQRRRRRRRGRGLGCTRARAVRVRAEEDVERPTGPGGGGGASGGAAHAASSWRRLPFCWASEAFSRSSSASCASSISRSSAAGGGAGAAGGGGGPAGGGVAGGASAAAPPAAAAAGAGGARPPRAAGPGRASSCGGAAASSSSAGGRGSARCGGAGGADAPVAGLQRRRLGLATLKRLRVTSRPTRGSAGSAARGATTNLRDGSPWTTGAAGGAAAGAAGSASPFSRMNCMRKFRFAGLPASPISGECSILPSAGIERATYGCVGMVWRRAMSAAFGFAGCVFGAPASCSPRLVRGGGGVALGGGGVRSARHLPPWRRRALLRGVSARGAAARPTRARRSPTAGALSLCTQGSAQLTARACAAARDPRIDRHTRTRGAGYTQRAWAEERAARIFVRARFGRAALTGARALLVGRAVPVRVEQQRMSATGVASKAMADAPRAPASGTRMGGARRSLTHLCR